MHALSNVTNILDSRRAAAQVVADEYAQFLSAANGPQPTTHDCAGYDFAHISAHTHCVALCCDAICVEEDRCDPDDRATYEHGAGNCQHVGHSDDEIFCARHLTVLNDGRRLCLRCAQDDAQPELDLADAVRTLQRIVGIDTIDVLHAISALERTRPQVARTEGNLGDFLRTNLTQTIDRFHALHAAMSA